MMKIIIKLTTILFFCICTNSYAADKYRIVNDALNREVKIPFKVKYIICSGSGCLRLATYMQANDLVVGVDEMEKKKNVFEARDYAIAYPEYKKLPLFGGMKGLDNPELILNLNPQPDVIFKIHSASGFDPEELQDKTGIPVVVLKYGDLGYFIDDFFDSLNIIGNVLGKEKRADELITIVKSTMNDLKRRTENIPDKEKLSCFVGGVAYNGPHGLCSTEPAYSPFKMVNVKNVAFDKEKNIKDLTHTTISKEKLLDWDPDIIFIDLATLQSSGRGSALYEIKSDAVYQELKAIKSGNIFGLLPYNYYSMNFDSVLANAYYIGKLLYPDKFSDILPEKVADKLYSAFVGKNIYSVFDSIYGKLSFRRIPLENIK